MVADSLGFTPDPTFIGGPESRAPRPDAEAMGGAAPGIAGALPAAGSANLAALSIHQLLREAIERGASDLHLTAGVPPVYRVDGSLRISEHPPMTRDALRKMVYSFLNDRQRSEFEEKLELDCSLEIASVGRFRVNVHKQRGSVEAALRVVYDEIRGLRDLGLPRVIEDLARRRNGLMLITGPTGSGKTTTMAAILDQINRERREMIITIEDPIEYIHRPKKSVIKQREINTDTHTFTAALRHALRQDPDVLAVGEMRDLETIGTALTAAETGHLVLATLHTPDATQTLDRIIDVFPPHQQQQVRVQLASSLVAIIAQQLMAVPGQEGRVAAVEILIANTAVRKIIRTGKHEQLFSIMQTAGELGMVTMDKSLKNLYEQGLISYDDAKNRARFPDTFDAV